MVVALRWLPAQAWTDGVVEERIKAQLDFWVESWIGPHLLSSLSVTRLNAPRLQKASRFEGLEGHLLLDMDEHTGTRLGLEMLGVNAKADSLNGQDQRLLLQLADRAVNALFDQFEVFFRPALSGNRGYNKRGADDWTVFAITLRISPVIYLSMGMSHALATWLRLSELPNEENAGQLHSPRQAVRSSSAHIAAYFGTVKAELDDVRRLAIGDVIMLDRAVDDPVDIIIDETGIQAACARLSHSKEGIELAFIAHKTGSNV